MPAFNRPAMTHRAVTSAFKQQPAPPAEVLVVDDCSTDTTGDAARSAGARVIRHETNQGEGAARNTALRHASHEWVALLDSDDEWLPNHLDSLWSSRSGRVLVAGSAVRRSPNGSHRLIGAVSERGITIGSPADIAVLRFIAASAVMFRRDVALDVGAFRPLPRAADLDLWLRILERGPGWVAPAVSVVYHEHAGQVSSDGRALLEAARAVLLQYSDRPWMTPHLLDQWDAVLAWHDFRIALARGDLSDAPGPLFELLLHPRRVPALGRLLAWRWRERRRTGRFTAEGAPSVAVRGTQGDAARFAREQYGSALRIAGPARFSAYRQLARRPSAVLVVDNALDASFARALGMHAEWPR